MRHQVTGNGENHKHLLQNSELILEQLKGFGVQQMLQLHAKRIFGLESNLKVYYPQNYNTIQSSFTQPHVVSIISWNKKIFSIFCSLNQKHAVTYSQMNDSSPKVHIPNLYEAQEKMF